MAVVSPLRDLMVELKEKVKKELFEPTVLGKDTNRGHLLLEEM